MRHGSEEWLNGWHRRWQQRAWSTVEAVRAKLTHTVLRALAAVVALAIAPVRCAVAHAQTGGNARPAIRAVAAEWTRRVLGAVATVIAISVAVESPSGAVVMARREVLCCRKHCREEQCSAHV